MACTGLVVIRGGKPSQGRWLGNPYLDNKCAHLNCLRGLKYYEKS
jgi:hypothetical protein